MPEDKELKDAMHHDHQIKLPKKDKSKTVWIVIAVILLLALIGLGAYGYMQINKLNKSIKDKDATISDLQNKKKTLEDTAAAAATAVTQAVTSNYLEVKELGFKLPLSTDIKDLQYFVNDKTAFFSTGSLQSSAWPSASNDATKFCSLGSMPLGVISKFANATDAGPTQQKALSGFVLGYAPPQSNCSTNQATIDIQNKQKAALVKAFSNAEKI
jgi:hypothetical protein